MTIKKSYYDMLKWICRNTVRKAVLIPDIRSVVKKFYLLHTRNGFVCCPL